MKHFFSSSYLFSLWPEVRVRVTAPGDHGGHMKRHEKSRIHQVDWRWWWWWFWWFWKWLEERERERERKREKDKVKNGVLEHSPIARAPVESTNRIYEVRIETPRHQQPTANIQQPTTKKTSTMRRKYDVIKDIRERDEFTRIQDDRRIGKRKSVVKCIRGVCRI